MHAQGTKDGQGEEENFQGCPVKWLGYGDKHSSWEPEAILNAACLQEYCNWQRKQTKGSGKAWTGQVQ